MERAVTPMDADREQAKGRIALWLDPEDLRWLSQHYCCSVDAPSEITSRCARLRFRARAALHKTGLADSGMVPETAE
jgi:hypothetical protein